MTPGLLRAYRRTRYDVGGIPLRIGHRSAAIDTLLRRHNARTGVLLTAWNPMSRPMPTGWNERMQRALRQRLSGLVTYEAEGTGRGWREAHVLLPVRPEPAERLARLFRQRAVVIVRIGQPVRLKILSR